MQEKERLDQVLVKKGFFTTRQKAKYAIEQQQVYINGRMVDKVSKLITDHDLIEIKGQGLPFVSRGGLKLDKAIRTFHISVANKICMDMGASTGGFTDCMLQNKAKKVYAIDVGHDQLAESLINNKAVVNIEGLNIKQLNSDEFEKVDFIGTDVSFISITHILPKIYECLKIRGKAVILIKPQFEAGKMHLNKNGVVKDSKIHKKIIMNIMMFASKLGFDILDLDYSPIKGPAGNIEYLAYIEKNENTLLDQFSMKQKIDGVVEDAFKQLK